MPIGMVASPAHVLTNKKIENKTKCLMEINKQDIKSSLKFIAFTAGVSGTAAVATGVLPKGTDFVKNAQKSVEGLIRKVKINDKSLMAKIQKTSVYKKFNVLPAPAKAAIAAGVAAIAVFTPFERINTIAKLGKIEGNFETKA